MSSVDAVSFVEGDALVQKPIIVGGWVPIVNINDPYVQEMGRFAVMEHDKETGEHIHFLRVVGGATQVVAGVNYKLVIEATRNGDQKMMIRLYEAVVWDKPWEKTWTLTSFKPLLPQV